MFRWIFTHGPEAIRMTEAMYPQGISADYGSTSPPSRDRAILARTGLHDSSILGNSRPVRTSHFIMAESISANRASFRNTGNGAYDISTPLLEMKLRDRSVARHLGRQSNEETRMLSIRPFCQITGCRAGELRAKKIQSFFSSRLFDVIFSFLSLIAAAPLMVIIAILIKIETEGSVFYAQERLGVNGRKFWMYKFRSMVRDAEKEGPAWAAIKDSRVTRVGKIIRKFRIDEIPQFFNVIRGDMSVIGPRPERPHFYSIIAKTVSRFELRLGVKPGITGLAQVKLPYSDDVEGASEKLSYDLHWINNRSLQMDLKILAATIRTIFLPHGAR